MSTAIELDDGYQAIEIQNTTRYIEAKTEVTRFVDSVTVTTLGALSRRYPKWQDILVSIVGSLKTEGRVGYEEYKPAPTRIESRRAIEKVKFITRAMVKKNPEKAFLFGDNLARRGFGGQAKEMRGEPNAIGIPTKNFPTMGDDAFFDDEHLELNKAHIDEAFGKLKGFHTVVIPADGIGTGLAELGRRAPRTFAYLRDRLDNIWKI